MRDVLTVMFTYLHNQFVYFKHFLTASFVSPREMGFLGVVFIFFVFVDANVFNIDLDFADLNRESDTPFVNSKLPQLSFVPGGVIRWA